MFLVYISKYTESQDWQEMIKTGLSSKIELTGFTRVAIDINK